jgi:acyl-CoA synthetase (AMP-forming)/AMP-acid ligase II
MLVGDLLHKSASRMPDSVALIGHNRRITYSEFDGHSNQLANALLGLGLEKGTKIAVLSRNCPAYAIAYYAIARTPYVSVHCSTRMVASELAYVLNKTEVDVLLLESRFSQLVADALSEIHKAPQLILLDQEPGINGAVSMREFAASMPTTAPDVSTSEVDDLAITMTGGTTGMPKAVLVSHKSRCASAEAAAQEFGLDDNDIVLASTPLFHSAGLFVWLGTAVSQGATVVFPGNWDPAEFVDIVEQEKITAAFLVPSQLNDLVSHADFSTERLRTLRNISYAGAPMGKAMFERIRHALPAISFTENYGQSEACPITIRRFDAGEEKAATVGKAACNAEVGIVDDEGTLLPAGEIGDIVTRGDQVFTEYFNDPQETAAAFVLPDGWLQTGDIGFLDDDGYLTLVDRSKDMLVSGAENVYPAEIENALYEHEAVEECAVFGIPHERWGEVPAAHIVLAANKTVTEEELIEYCAKRIARFKRPRSIRFVTSLPKTAVGKVRKNELRAPYWEGRDRPI